MFEAPSLRQAPIALGDDLDAEWQRRLWADEITAGAPDIATLPEKAKAYLDRLSELCETPIRIVGVGPDRKETLLRD